MNTQKTLFTNTQQVGFYAALALAFFVTAGTVSADILNRQLQLGMSGADVTALQTFLAKDSSLYPQGLVTGYYGILTQAAVSNFQARNGISAVGRVGPATLPVLNLQMAGGVSTGNGSASPTIGNVNVSTSSNNATVNWTTNESAKGVVYYSTSPLSIYENTNSANISGNTAMTDTNFRSSQSVSVQGLSSNTLYYYVVYVTDQEGNVSMTWPNTFRTTN